MDWYSALIFTALATVTFACRDLYPKLCEEYKNNTRVDTCKYKGIGPWMQENCKLSCNLCHLYTTLKPSTPKPRTVPPMVNCGKSFKQKGRVIAGDDATPGAWPWQVKLTYRGKFLCGGSLVSPIAVVTAAHCLTRKRVNHFKVVLGEHNRNVSEGSEITYDVRRFHIYGKYSMPHHGFNDIAVLKLNKPVVFNDRIQRICLPDYKEELPEGTECFITGWGKTKHPGAGSEILQQASLRTVSYEKCKYNEGMKRLVSKSMLCAGSLQDPKSGCHGDSGGPFVCKKSDGRWFLYGVVSWGSPTCYYKHAYSVFTKVSHYRGYLDRLVWY